MKFKEYPYIQAKYFSDRNGMEPEMIILHYTAGRGNALELGNFFKNGVRKASAHFGIGRINQTIQGITTNICQYVDCGKNSWHPGVSKFKDGKGNIGRRSIGVEICGSGFNVKGLPADRIFKGKHRNPACGATEWEKYTELQYTALDELIRKIKATYPSVRYLTFHEDIRNTNVVPELKGSKTDCGPAMDISRLSATLQELGIEEWHWSFKRKLWCQGLPID